MTRARCLKVACSEPLGVRAPGLVGTDEAGGNLAGLYLLIATREVNGVNPVEYIADVLMRVQTHSAWRIDELLPHNRAAPRPEPPA